VIAVRIDDEKESSELGLGRSAGQILTIFRPESLAE
jgi:hypothetical protein